MVFLNKTLLHTVTEAAESNRERVRLHMGRWSRLTERAVDMDQFRHMPPELDWYYQLSMINAMKTCQSSPTEGCLQS